MSRQVLVDMGSRKPEAPAPSTPLDVWMVVGWLGLLLTAVALSDFAIAFIPMHFGSPEWEFGTIASVFSGLPLLTMGLVALWLSATVRGIGWQVAAVAGLLLLGGLVVAALLVVFLTDAPMALRASQGPVKVGIWKAIAKTSLLGLIFASTYVVMAIVSFRRRPRREEGAADA